MSIQPLIAVAFSSVPAAVSAVERRSAAVSSITDKTAITDTNSIAAVSSRDSGKPLSASGDVLDLSSQKQLNQEEQEQVAKLKARDTEVRAHEQAHLATAGQYAKGGASYSFQTGPDGVRYATGGEVAIDASPVKGDPEATVSKAQQIRAAALAPASPSSQDYRVAAAASEMEANARIEQSRKVGDTENTDEITRASASTSAVATATKTTASSSATSSVAAAYLSQSRLSSASRWSSYA